MAKGRVLVFKWLISSNFVSDWWKEYVYLLGRSPIMLNSNFYVIELFNKPLKNRQTARAANCIRTALDFRTVLDHQNVKPIMAQDAVPICFRQYKRHFNTLRIPQRESDRIVNIEELWPRGSVLQRQMVKSIYNL